MKTVKTFARQLSFSLMMAMTLGSAIVSCGSILDEEDVDCSVEYRVKFKYDYNMKYADAFSREVGTVTLYAFDDNGKLVYQKTEEGDVLGEDGYTMKVDLEPGDYHLITWAGLNNEASFSVPLVTAGESSMDELQCKMDRMYSRAEDGTAIVNSKLSSLWHGEVTKQSFSRAATSQVVTVPLVKNTNSIRIILQQMDGVTVDVDNFEFTITDDNGLMNYDNKLLKDETLTYYPYYRVQGSTDMDTKGARAEGDTEDSNISVAIFCQQPDAHGLEQPASSRSGWLGLYCRGSYLHQLHADCGRTEESPSPRGGHVQLYPTTCCLHCCRLLGYGLFQFHQGHGCYLHFRRCLSGYFEPEQQGTGIL